MNKILLLNGPNLNMLGRREPEKYGSTSLNEIIDNLKTKAKAYDIEILDYQSNHEGNLIDFIHKESQNAKAMIFNPGAFTHSSIALRDAILAVELPFIEIHLSNVYKREKFRHQSYFKDIALGQIIGLGALGYELALKAIAHKIQSKEL